MKKFKIIQDFTQDEFDDFTFFITKIQQDKTNLKFIIYSIANQYFNKNIPHIMIFMDNNINHLNYKSYINYDAIKISNKPYFLSNNLKITEEDLIIILEFIKSNKKILMKYWGWKCGSRDLINSIKRI